MDYLTYSKRLEYLLDLIEKGKLNSPNDVASSFGCSEKTVRNMLNDLRAMGNEIKFSRREGKYFLLETKRKSLFRHPS